MLLLLVLVSGTRLLVSVFDGGPVLQDNLAIGSGFKDMVVGFDFVLVGPGFQEVTVEMWT